MLNIDEKYCKIINRFTGKIIAAGKIINHKDIPVKCITFDNKHFFNLNGNFFYKIILCDHCNEVKFNSIKYRHSIKPWKFAPRYKRALVYREHDISELDEEVKHLVDVLNKGNFQTTGSCSGHNIEPAYVDIIFYSFDQIKFMANTLSKNNFTKKFKLSTSEHIVNDKPGSVIFRLETFKIGKDAYKDLDKFAEYLKIII